MTEQWAGLKPPYSTIVADPPWHYDAKRHVTRACARRPDRNPQPLGYSTMTVAEISALPIGGLSSRDAHCYLWTTHKYLPEAFGVLAAWGFSHREVLTWAKTPGGMALGGTFLHTSEFCLFAKRGSPRHKERVETTWWNWPRLAHSVKPPAFYDLVERVSPGPYVELFARQPRLGWDSWGRGYEEVL